LKKISVGDYLIQQIYNQGIRHIFGVPGDYILGFYDMLVRSKMIIVNTCDEQGAGFAADAYARLSGLGVVCVTYGVGGLKVANTTAQAYAEKSPVIVISGAPGMKERENDVLLHHKVRGFDTQEKVFEQITVFSTVLEKPDIAKEEISKAISYAKRFKRPVYIELPRDIVYMPINGTSRKFIESWEKADPMILTEAVNEAKKMINAAKRPVIIAA
jgi:TPP-dependent 2-oxoacid decarboxylase